MMYRKVPTELGDPILIPGPPESAAAMQAWLLDYRPLMPFMQEVRTVDATWQLSSLSPAP